MKMGAFALCAAAMMGSACKKERALAVVERPVLVAQKGALADKCVAAAAATGKFQVSVGKVPGVGERGLKLRIDTDGDAEGAIVRARIEDVTSRPDGRPIVQNGQGRPPVDAFANAVCADLGRRVRIAFAADAEVVAAVTTGVDVERDEAIATAADRRLKAAVPALLPLLKDDDEERRDLVIGALREIRDPRAVKPLTEVVRFADTDGLPKIFDALATIGGPEARAYLEFVASGHPHGETKALAKRSLDKIDGAEAKGR